MLGDGPGDQPRLEEEKAEPKKSEIKTKGLQCNRGKNVHEQKKADGLS